MTIQQLQNQLQQLNIRALRHKPTGTYCFCAIDIMRLFCGTSPSAAKSYWHYFKNHQDFSTCRGYIHTQLNLPSADGRFRMTDVIDSKTLMYLLKIIPHKGASCLHSFVEKYGILCFMSMLKDAGRSRSQAIVAYARARGKGFVMGYITVTEIFDIRNQKPMLTLSSCNGFRVCA